MAGVMCGISTGNGRSFFDSSVSRVCVKKEKNMKKLNLQSVEKPPAYLKMGSQGRSPRQGLGAVAPVKSPFPGERGQGDRDSEL